MRNKRRHSFERYDMDPELPARVYRIILREPRWGGHDPHPLPPTVRAPRRGSHSLFRTAGMVAVLLVFLSAQGQPPDGVWSVAAPATVRANPIEARAAWERAKALEGAHWLVRLRAYQAVLTIANPTDRSYPRALGAIARLLREAGRAQAALAAEAHASSLGPRRDEKRVGALLAYAKALRGEGEVAVAQPLLEAVVALGRVEAPQKVEGALVLLAEDAFDTGARALLARWIDRMEAEDVSGAASIRALGDLGTLHLEGGDEAAARACLERARRIYVVAHEGDGPAAIRAVRAWLDLPLGRVLRTER